jgi:hypothetical protein
MISDPERLPGVIIRNGQGSLKKAGKFLNDIGSIVVPSLLTLKKIKI